MASDPVGPGSAGLAQPGPERVAAVQRRTVRLFVAVQMLGGVGVALGIAVAALLASDLAGTDTLAGLATTAPVLGAAGLAVVVAAAMQRYGRRPGLALAYGCGSFGAAVVVVAAVVGSFPLALVGLLFFGGGTAAGLQSRYAATDLAAPDRRGRALSVVVWATTVGAVAGPNLAGPAGRLAAAAGVPRLAGPFLIGAVVFLLAALSILAFLRPDPLVLSRAVRGASRPPRVSTREALRVVRSYPDAVLGLSAVAVGHSVMVGVMAMTPIHLHHGGGSLEVIGVVISVHIAGMYALSPVAGWLTDRFGCLVVIRCGVAFLLVAAAIVGTAPAEASVQVGVGLVVIGLGWSCTLVAGSTLLTEAVPADARPAAQGAADFVMGLAAAVASVLAGIVVGVAGYPFLALLAAIALAPLGAAVLRGRSTDGAPTRAGGPVDAELVPGPRAPADASAVRPTPAARPVSGPAREAASEVAPGSARPEGG